MRIKDVLVDALAFIGIGVVTVTGIMAVVGVFAVVFVLLLKWTSFIADLVF